MYSANCIVFHIIYNYSLLSFFFFQAEDGIRDGHVTGVQTCALPISTEFNLIDTGGIELGNEPLLVQMREQADIAINEADVIIFIVNLRDGITAADEEVAKILYRSNKPVVLAVNKFTNPK